MMNSLLAGAIHLGLVLLWPPLVVGLVRRTKARLACRRGPPLLQAYYDTVKLLRKDEVVADTTSWVFRATPAVSFCIVVLVGLMVPTLTVAPPLSAFAHLLVIVYLLGLDRFFRIVAAMDTGTAFGGMGASREAFLATLAEPVMVLCLWCIGLLTGTLAIPEMVAGFSSMAVNELSPVYPLVLVPLVLVALVENARMPVDDPTTHLELTMIHEAMSLEYSGRGLALVEWGAMIKLTTFLALLANLFLPVGLAAPDGSGLAAALGSYLLRTGALAVALGVLESAIARFAFFRVADLMGLALACSVLALIRIVTVGR